MRTPVTSSPDRSSVKLANSLVASHRQHRPPRKPVRAGIDVELHRIVLHVVAIVAEGREERVDGLRTVDTDDEAQQRGSESDGTHGQQSGDGQWPRFRMVRLSSWATSDDRPRTIRAPRSHIASVT